MRATCLFRTFGETNLTTFLPRVIRYELDKMYKTPKVRTSVAVIGHTSTGLFKEFHVTHAYGRFLGPTCAPEEIAERMVDVMEIQESRYIFHPWVNYTAPLLKAMPSFLRDHMQWASGADGTYPSRPSKAQLGLE